MLARLIQRYHANCCGADPCCHGNEIWARRGDPDAYRLVQMCFSVLAFVSLVSSVYQYSGGKLKFGEQGTT